MKNGSFAVVSEHNPSGTSIRFESNVKLPITNDSIVAGLAPHLHHTNNVLLPQAGLSSEQRAEKIVSLLVGSAKTRIASAPTPEALAFMKGRVLASIDAGKPVQAIVNWGPLKFSRDLRNSGVDLADFLALESLIRLNGAAKQFHSDGVQFVIYLEDMTADWLERPVTGLGRMKDTYMGGLKKLGQILGPDRILFVKESDVLSKRGITREEYFRKAEDNLAKFEAYWAESEPLIRDFFDRTPEYTDVQWNNFCEQKLKKLKSYGHLERIGWQGFISPKMRDYYLKKHPDLPQADANHEVCKYFASTLLKHQWKLCSGIEGLPAPIKISFVSTPPGAPNAIKESPRVDLRILSRDVASSHMPSWACKGVLAAVGGEVKPCLRSWREMADKQDSVLPANLIISNKSHSVTVKADVLPISEANR